MRETRDNLTRVRVIDGPYVGAHGRLYAVNNNGCAFLLLDGDEGRIATVAFNKILDEEV